jgi:hypothetical protein
MLKKSFFNKVPSIAKEQIPALVFLPFTHTDSGRH